MTGKSESSVCFLLRDGKLILFSLGLLRCICVAWRDAEDEASEEEEMSEGDDDDSEDSKGKDDEEEEQAEGEDKKTEDSQQHFTVEDRRGVDKLFFAHRCFRL